MNEDKMMAPKNVAEDEFTVQKISNGHSYIWRGQEWVATAKPDLALKIVEWIKREKTGG